MPCLHLDGLTEADFQPPDPPDACEDCLREGTTWVALRECRECGHVACCDSSEVPHATRHFHESGHPVMRSITTGDHWTWCYVDHVMGRLS